MASSTKHIRLTHGQKQRLREHFLSAVRARMTHRELAEWAVATFKLLHAPSRMTLRRALKSPPEGATIRPTVKANRRVCSRALEENLLKWIQACETWQLSIVTCATIQGKAAKIREEIVAAAPKSADKALQAMNFSRGWLCKFQRRHNPMSKCVSSEAASVDSTVVEARRTSLQRVAQAFAKYDVFNLDESTFFYCAPPSKAITAQPIKGRKASKKRITVAIACNADGTTKIPLLFVGVSCQPRCFGGRSGAELGLDYSSTPKMWMTTQLFQTWLRRFNDTMRAANRHVLLLLDNASSHRHDKPLSNVTLRMFPPNTTACLQPQDAGIIRQFKSQALKRQTRHVVDWFDNFLGRAGEEEEEEQDNTVVLLAADQRQPLDDEPCCAVCSRYGAYICDATDEDVCSMECRDVCVMRHREARVLSEEQVKQRALAAKLLRRRLEIRVTSGSAAATDADDDGNNAHSLNSSTQMIIPFPIVDFADCDLPPQLYANMQKELFEKPSPVQMQVLPCVLARHSLLVVAPTGTGKTAAYLIPIIAQLINGRLSSSYHHDDTADDLSSHRSSAIAVILAPIRELATQIEEVAKLLAQGVPNMKTALLVGGFPMPPQLHRLQSGVQVVVATPGRFIDVFTNYDLGVINSSDTDQGRQQETSLASVVCCVVDEVDMMLAIGFHAQISRIIGLLPPLAQMQLLFFSATISTQVEALVKQILLGTKTPQSDQQQQLSNYFRIEVGRKKQRQGDDANFSSSSTTYTANPNIRQKIIWAEDKAKKKLLFDFLKSKQNEATFPPPSPLVILQLVFVKSKIGANLLADAVEKQTRIPSASIHADKSQKDRLLALEAFVNQDVRVLVSTNVLSRGMDLLQVQNVVVFDFPNKVSDYIHLIGRTGRGNDASGNALVMVNKDDKVMFKELVGALRDAKVGAVPQEIYQSLYADAQKETFKSSALVIDEAKRAFRVQDELGGELGQPHESWRQWSKQAQKKQRQA